MELGTETTHQKAGPSWNFSNPAIVEETQTSEAALKLTTITQSKRQTVPDFDVDSLFDAEFDLDLSPAPPELAPLPQRTPRKTLRKSPKETPPDTTPTTSDPGRTRERRTGTPLYEFHEHNEDKLKNWRLNPSRPILIIGDSNISKLPSISDDRIQVDCYLGANLNHAKHLLRHNTPTSRAGPKIILSFGLNNGRHCNSTLIKKELHGMLEAAKVTFPQAEIFIPIINLSDDLPGIIKNNIKELNFLIKETGQQVPRLERQHFLMEINYTGPPKQVHKSQTTGCLF